MSWSPLYGHKIALGVSCAQELIKFWQKSGNHKIGRLICIKAHVQAHPRGVSHRGK